MAPENSETSEIIAGIQIAAKGRAEQLAQNPILSEWVKDFRHKYIADGFLIPFYTWDGMYSRPRKRISELGDFILPYETAGSVFDENGTIEMRYYLQHNVSGGDLDLEIGLNFNEIWIITGDTLLNITSPTNATYVTINESDTLFFNCTFQEDGLFIIR